MESQSGFHLENCPSGEATGGIWILWGWGMMVKDVANFHKCHLGDWDMLEYVCVRDFIQDFEFWEGGGGSSVLT